LLDLCAFAGVSPLDELTPRELVRLAKTRQTIAWDHTSVIIATALNMMRTKHSETARPEQFNPYRTATVRRPRGGLSLAEFTERVKGMQTNGQ